jgi:hypothetical protein
MAEPKETRTVDIIVNGQKANASLKELDASVAVLNSQFRKMAADDPGRAKLLADLQAARARVADVRKEITGVTETTGVMKQAFANAFALLTGGGIVELAQKLFGFFSDSRQEALGSAKASADLDTTLRSTAHAAGLTAAEIRKIGEERAKVTLFDDDETNKASALLLTFTNIKKGVFEEAMPAIQDLATKMGGDGPADMKGAAIQVGKALNDPIAGISALSRVGVSFTAQQKEQITQMVKAGNAAGAQKLILAELNKEFGGSAEAARKAAGGMATLSMWFGEFKETVGGEVNAVLDTLSQWLGRVIDKSQPLVDIVMEVVDMFAEFYHEISDVLVSLGLFNEKTDTAAIAIEVLKTALTLLLFPLKVGLQAVKGMVDVFIDWYNKSELLRGVLGGLGGAIVSLFTTIKDDALKILGGVGDILIGIFSLDKNKIIAGFKSALSATADVALESGNKAAAAFMKGYEANKNNRITRTVRVKTEEEGSPEGAVPTDSDKAPAGESEKDKKARLAKLKALQDKADQARLDALKALVAQEEALEDARVQTIADRREREIAEVNLAATRKARLVTGTEREVTEQLAGIVAERDRKLQELAAKYQKEADDREKEAFDKSIADEDAAEVEREAKLQQRFQDGLDSEAQYRQNVYDAKHASLEAELLLEQAYGGKTSKEYRKTQAELLKLEKDRNKEVVADAKNTQKAKADLAKMELSVARDVLTTTLELLFADEEARRKHHSLYVALSTAKVLAEGIAEVQAIWSTYSEMGPVGVVLAGIQTAVSVARTASAIGQLKNTGGGSGEGSGSYWAGGRTGKGDGLAVSPMGQLLQMSGMSTGSNGRLEDGSGFAVAGVVHEDEYVIPKWQRADPQVAAVEQWLEARRMRGFADGGPTTSRGATLPVPAASPVTGEDKIYAVLAQVLDANRSMVQQLADVKTWQSTFQVVNNLRDTQSGLATIKKVKLDSAIRSKSAPDK